jgi:hypothetical protein
MGSHRAGKYRDRKQKQIGEQIQSEIEMELMMGSYRARQSGGKKDGNPQGKT